MNKKSFSFLITIAVSVFLSFCHARTVEEPSDIVTASNKFAINFYREIESEDRGNIFFSPFSIVSAFGMAYEGARGKTSEQIQSVFFLPGN
ncbi:MAG: serpin family protein, partial [Candidatus Ratteibacteria bacterium]